MNQDTPTSRQRRAVDKVWRYEWADLEDLAERIADCEKAGDRIGVNANLESFLVHVRNLLEFFNGRYDGKRHRRKWSSGSVSARDFASTWDIPADQNHLDDIVDDIDKTLAHLTWTRVDRPTNIDWDPWALIDLLTVELRSLIEALEAEGRRELAGLFQASLPRQHSTTEPSPSESRRSLGSSRGEVRTAHTSGTPTTAWVATTDPDERGGTFTTN